MSISLLRTSLIFPLAAFWPVWIYLYKFSLKSFDYGIFVLVFLLVYFVIEQIKLSGEYRGSVGFLFFSWLLVVVYMVLNGKLPALANAMIAMEAMACAIIACFPSQMLKKRVAYLILFPLALPLGATLQFVVGYPLRKITAAISVFILGPYDVSLKGTTLYYGTKALEIDVPCSGVSGLWAFLLAAGFVSLILRYNWIKLGAALSSSMICAMFYNILRTSMLFMGRFHFGEETPFMHGVIGTVAFLAAFGIFLITTKMVVTRLNKRK